VRKAHEVIQFVKGLNYQVFCWHGSNVGNFQEKGMLWNNGWFTSYFKPLLTMKKWIPAALFYILFVSCRKNFIDKQELPEPITTAVVDVPCEEEEWDGEFLSEATFPGGRCAWMHFLRHHLTYPAEAVDAEIQGIVVVGFIINESGDVSNIEALSGPGELKQSAVDAMKQSPKWRPGVINGRAIKCYKKQPISFRLEEE